MPKKVISDQDLACALARVIKGSPTKRVAASYGIGRSTLYKKYKNFCNEGRLGWKKVERREKMSQEEKEAILRVVQRQPFISRDDIRRKLNLSISNSTVTKYIKQFKISNRISPNKFQVQPDHRMERLSFASIRRNWTLYDWTKYIFTDESGMDNGGGARKRVWRSVNARFDPDFVHYRQNKTFRVNFFSWVSIYGVGKLYFYDRMDSELYCEIATDMMQTLRAQFGAQDFRIIHDNARISCSRFTENFIETNGISQHFEHIPPYSPDMNIIENLWALVKRKVRERTNQFGRVQSRGEFESLIADEWQSIPPNIVINLYNSLPNRMAAIIENKGYLSEY